jgi:formylglycine-generating enzyme required for sulfatase activity
MSEEPPPHLLTLAKGITMAFRWLLPTGPEGFIMGQRGEQGNEEPAHRVQITQGFWIAETPVTQAQFAVWTKAAKVQHENVFKNQPDNPAENLSWFEAVEFCRWLTQTHRDQFPASAKLAALPTEAEWEYACRAGTATDYYTGDDVAALEEAGWFNGNSHGATHPVRQKARNACHLYDMHGNVWEWCSDWHGEYPKGAVTDPTGPREGSDRVDRGGSWDYGATMCRSSFRGRLDPSGRNFNNGFRLALSSSAITK